MSRTLALVLAATMLVASLVPDTAAAQDLRRYIEARSAGDAGLPFSEAVQVGSTLYVAGKIGLRPDNTVPDTAAEEARLVLDDVRATLARAGMDMDDLVSVQVFCSDVKYYDEFNAVYRDYFTREFPARSFIGAGTLLFNARFEVNGIAVKRP